MTAPAPAAPTLPATEPSVSPISSSARSAGRLAGSVAHRSPRRDHRGRRRSPAGRRRHSIRELVFHVDFWIDAARRRIGGDAVDGLEPEIDWALESPEPPPRRLESGARPSRGESSATARDRPALDEARFDQPVAGSDPTLRGLLLGILQHNAYHTGQIALLAKAATRHRSAHERRRASRRGLFGRADPALHLARRGARPAARPARAARCRAARAQRGSAPRSAAPGRRRAGELCGAAAARDRPGRSPNCRVDRRQRGVDLAQQVAELIVALALHGRELRAPGAQPVVDHGGRGGGRVGSPEKPETEARRRHEGARADVAAFASSAICPAW